MKTALQTALHASTPIVIAPGVVLRSLQSDDGVRLATYFSNLAPATTRRFQPHLLNASTAHALCAAAASGAVRLVLAYAGTIIGYFILDPRMLADDAARYALQGISLESGIDLLFAPSIADAWQNQGLSSLAMPHLIAFATLAGSRSLVLMGGTQATNARAIRFYEKFGFERFGGYQTDVWNHDMRRLLNG